MGNSHPGANGAMPPGGLPPTHSSPHTQYHTTISHPQSAYLNVSSAESIPVPHRSDSFERELSSSLSGMSGLSAHMSAKNQTQLANSMETGPDFISPGQYMARYRANSVSVEPEFTSKLPKINQTLPAVIKWDKGGTHVSISGTFNSWDKTLPLVKSTNNFYTIVELAEGEHHYKYNVDGQWVINPDEPTVTDSQGNQNNVVKVKKSDFEIIEALEDDGDAVKHKADAGKSSSELEYPQSDYNQDIPVRKATDRHVGPPVLPQHLLQVILNKDVSPHLEPGMLPEPNHVMLNHLYALSIKEGVMVLSDTSRFRKKCVTTLLYKPID